LAHGQIVIKRYTGRIALASTPNDVIALHVITGTYTAVAHDTGIVVHLNHRRRHVLPGLNRSPWEAGRGNALLRGEIEQQIRFACGTPGVTIVARHCLWIVCHEEFGQHRPGALDGVALRLHHHAVLSLPNAGGL
jgi:hypothetical protein